MLIGVGVAGVAAVVLWLCGWLGWWICVRYQNQCKQERFFGRRFNWGAASRYGVVANSPKPDWVRQEVLALNAQLNAGVPYGGLRLYGVRKLACHFNALHGASGMTVGKTFVAQTLQSHALACLRHSKQLKHVQPAAQAPLQVWGVDSTVISNQNPSRNQHTVLGIIDHGSRILTALQTVRAFNAWTALGTLFIAIGQWGKPRAVRTDNAAVFHSRLWCTILACMGIRVQYTKPGHPWQNGRIERLFGTFKRHWRLLCEPLRVDVPLRLKEFQHWYNTARPHQHLNGRTPMQEWARYAEPQPGNWVVENKWGGVLKTIRPRE